MGVLEGSSVMGYTQAEYEALPQAERQAAKDRAREIFLAAGADGVLDTLDQLPQWLEENGQKADEK